MIKVTENLSFWRMVLKGEEEMVNNNTIHQVEIIMLWLCIQTNSNKQHLVSTNWLQNQHTAQYK